MVPVTGLEPVRCRQRWILSPLRLPFHHTGRFNLFIIPYDLQKFKRKFPHFQSFPAEKSKGGLSLRGDLWYDK